MKSPLRVAVVHYHLKRGGVTRVIDSLAGGFGADATAPRLAVLCGEAPPAESRLPVSVVGGLGYSRPGRADPAPGELANRLRAAARSVLGGEPDLWHVHNPTLGKNGALTGALDRLARDGEALLLQLHDFAEDGRPGNYKLLAEHDPRRLYPISPRIAYAVLNRRDHDRLARCGVPGDALHLLPNPVPGPVAGGSDGRAVLGRLGADRLVLYPVRALRRKNLGEFLLWSALAESGTCFAMTLGPTNPAYRERYGRWRDLAAELGLPVRWELSADGEDGFAEIVAAAEQVLTTSVAEGFGLAFLEPRAFGRPVGGRELPTVTAGFREAGIELGDLYQRLSLPLDWVGERDLRQRIGTALEATWRAYGLEPAENAAETAFSAVCDRSSRVDFGGLDEVLQERVLRRIRTDPAARRELMPSHLEIPADPGQVARNAAAIERSFGLAAYCERVRGIYSDLAEAPAGPLEHLDARSVLDAFLDPSDFLLLRT